MFLVSRLFLGLDEVLFKDTPFFRCLNCAHGRTIMKRASDLSLVPLCRAFNHTCLITLHNVELDDIYAALHYTKLL